MSKNINTQAASTKNKTPSKKYALSMKYKLEALHEINLIIEDAINFIKNGQAHYDRVLSSALFTLLIKEGANRPLLINIANEFDTEIQIEKKLQKIKLINHINTYLDGKGWSSGVLNQSLTKREFLVVFRNKKSLSHQDPNVTSEMFHSSSMAGWHIGGLPSETYMLLSIAEGVLPLATKVYEGGIQKLGFQND
jgi:hypothetical protein